MSGILKDQEDEVERVQPLRKAKLAGDFHQNEPLASTSNSQFDLNPPELNNLRNGKRLREEESISIPSHSYNLRSLDKRKIDELEIDQSDSENDRKRLRVNVVHKPIYTVSSCYCCHQK